MLYKKLSLQQAKNILDNFDRMNDEGFELLTSEWNTFNYTGFDPSYSEFRSKLVKVFKKALEETGGKLDYLLDLRVGLYLYNNLMPLGKDFSVVSANDDDIWRYISVCVIPDLTYFRYPDPGKGDIRINKKRFYSHKRRIWIKTLWWYIHLSWQGTEEKTFEVLKNNGIDNINKLIETPGKGYRLSLYRAMMREYGETGPHSTNDFLSMTKLNNIKCNSVEPELVSGGINNYVKQLVAEISEKGEKS